MEKCPKCNNNAIVKAGLVQNKQRFKCKSCSYHFTGDKSTKAIHDEKVITCLELYLCGLSYREIEAATSVSHVSVMNWVKKFEIGRKTEKNHHYNYKILKYEELVVLINDPHFLKEKKIFINPLNDKFILYELDA